MGLGLGVGAVAESLTTLAQCRETGYMKQALQPEKGVTSAKSPHLS